jgi:hypothetical protein
MEYRQSMSVKCVENVLIDAALPFVNTDPYRMAAASVTCGNKGGTDCVRRANPTRSIVAKHPSAARLIFPPTAQPSS